MTNGGRKKEEFYVTGGPVSPDAPSYIIRTADKELCHHLSTGEFCYVLVSRQMGKSSLMEKARRELQSQNIRAASVILSSLGIHEVTASQWYYGIAARIMEELGVHVEWKKWWEESHQLPSSQRLINFFKEVVLKNVVERVVIFLDEIDTTIRLDFTDDFFAAIRACYTNRIAEPEFQRLTFALFGVASPSDLIKDAKRTPFNIGRRIELTDFSFEEVKPLAEGFVVDKRRGEQILKYIVDWTKGHPYLTQSLCQLVADRKSLVRTEKELEQIVVEKLFTPAALFTDDHFAYVRKYLTDSKSNPQKVLRLYCRILQNGPVNDNPLSPIHTILKLSGLVTPQNGKLCPRNPIYERIFTVEWAKKELQALPRLKAKIIIAIIAAIAPLIIMLNVQALVMLVQARLSLFLPLYFVYLIAVFLFSFAERLRITLLPKLASSLTDKVEIGLRLIFSRFYKRYIDKLRAQHRFFNVKGITIQSAFSLELKEVFIDLKMSPKFHRQKTDGQPQELTKDIWDLLESDDPQYRILVIIGKPGSGKTTLLQHVALLIVTGKARGKSNRFIPFHLALRNCVADITSRKSGAPTLAQLLEKDFHELNPPPGWFLQKLRIYGDRCVVLLDGLDEVANGDEREKVTNWVEAQASNYSQTRFVLTSRPHGYVGNAIQGATILQIEDFSETQIRNFVNKWYRGTEIAATGKSERDVIARAEENARDLLQRIFQSEILSKLAFNPMLLTMVTMVHRYIGKLPEKRAELYEDIIRVLSSRRETAIKGIKLSYYQKRDILQTLALAMMRERRREITTREAIAILHPDLELVNLKAEDGQFFLDMIMNETGLLVENDPGRLAFSHLTYQEFLSAAKIKDRQKEDFLIERLSDLWWHETILLYVATSDATRIVQACLNQSERSLETLKLAYEISQEAKQIAPQERKRLEDILVLEAESDDSEKQQLAADLIFEIRLKKMIRLTNNVDVDPFFISQLEYQNFVNQTGRRPDHWPGLRYSTREGLKPIVGVRYNDAEAYAQWLTVRAVRELGHRTSQFRLPTKEEAELVKTDQEVQDQNFKQLASLELGAWAIPMNTLIFSDNEKSAATSSLLRMRAVGEGETRQLGDYHSFMGDLLEKLDYLIETRRRDLEATPQQLESALAHSALKALSDEVDRYLEEFAAIKDAFRNAASRAQERNFSITFDSNIIDELSTELVELSRLRSSRAGLEVYQDADIGKIHQLLSKARNRLEGLRVALYDPAARAKRYQQDLLNYLSTELQSFAGKPIDLDQQLAFLSKLGDIRLSTNEIQAVLRREIGKNYTKAKSELLALAEYALHQNKTELLREILRGFWAVFFIEQRANRQNPLPAWEGIRLVREIRRPDEETTHI